MQNREIASTADAPPSVNGGKDRSIAYLIALADAEELEEEREEFEPVIEECLI
jgi:hypothetical protein